MNTPITDEEAIRRVILDGTVGDFYDVAKVVKERFCLDVSTQKVEEVYRELQQESSPTTMNSGIVGNSRDSDSSHMLGAPHGSAKEPLKIGRVDIALRSEIPKSGIALAPSGDKNVRREFVESNRTRVLEFVEAMGGFDAARAAITDLEKSLKQLME